MSEFTYIFLIRHGQTDWNVSRRVMGGLPIPLNEEGQRQAKALEGAFEGISLDAIYHSPYLRTQETAEYLRAKQAIEKSPHDGLREVDYGEWQGKSFDELKQHEVFKAYFRDLDHCTIPGGESMQGVQDRVVACITELAERHRGQSVALVSHSDVVKAALIHYLKLPLNALHHLCIDNGSVSLLLLSDSLNRVVTINRTPELSAVLRRWAI